MVKVSSLGAALLLVAGSVWTCTAPTDEAAVGSARPGPLVKVEMKLSALGVESDDFPSIDVVLDFAHATSSCTKSFYNPAYKGSTYQLSAVEMEKVAELLQRADWSKLKTFYASGRADQPTSTTTIHNRSWVITIKDYGLVGDYPLQELYQIVYRL